MPYNTGNPIPSSDAKDLSDNAENLDNSVNTALDTWTDRLGVERRTIQGQLKLLGYTAPDVYAGGLVFTIADNMATIERNKVIYAPLPSALPFTTSGTWTADDEDKFFVVQGLTTSSDEIVLSANAVADMKTKDLQPGQIIRTKVNNTTSNAGGATYIIQTAAEFGGTPDEIYDITLNNGNIATFVVESNFITLAQGGSVGSVDESNIIQSAIDRMEPLSGTVYGVKDLTYITSRQITVKHGVTVDFANAVVNFVQATTNNDSPFQMGNNTSLKNISEGTYNSTSPSAFGTSGWVKVGEFYALISGAPSSGENSFDSSYWEPDNVQVENVHTNMSQQLTEDSRGYGHTIGHSSATNCVYKNISNDGLCADGNPSKATRATIRTETGVDINAGRQGYNIVIENIKGSNLRAQSENAVVYINGDRNTHIKNVVGDSCGAILGIRPNRFFANQDPSMQGRSGLNILAENIIGTNCRKVSGDTSSHLLCAMYLRSNEGDDLSNNKSSFIVRNVALFSTAIETEKLSIGAQMGDSVLLPSETNVGCRRVTVSGFEIVGFPEGLNEETGCLNNTIENGFIRDCDNNGANLKGARSIYKNIKVWENNKGSQASANNGHGIRLSCTQGIIDNCSLGNDALGAGNETQKSGIFIVSDDTTAQVKNCHFDNYMTGENVLGQRVVSNANVYVDQFCTSKFVTLSKGSYYHLSPDVAKASLAFDSSGVAQYSKNCSVVKSATGKYDVTFDKPMANTEYRVLFASNFQYVAARYTAKTVNGFQVASRNVSGTDTDSGFDLNVYGDYDTTV